MIIGITGGKGGTGKSTIATSIAYYLSQKGMKVLLVDADVGCPNDHLIINAERKKVKDVYITIPEFDYDKCTKCGVCSKVCRANAIVFVKDKKPIFVPEQCSGCKACILACPNNAIRESKKKVGTIYSYSKNFDCLSAESVIGLDEESIVVNALKEKVSEVEKNYDYIIIDTAAGTHCSVISALKYCDKAFAVTEPTPFGEHDLRLILKLLKIMNIDSGIILNKSTIGDKGLIKKVSRANDVEIIGEVPYSKKIVSSYSKSEQIIHKSIKEIVGEIL